MKQKCFLLPLLAALLLTVSCRKSDHASTTDVQKVEAIKVDPDWLVVANNNDKLIQKFIDKKIDVSTFDFTNEAAFLKVIDMNRSTYLTTVAGNKAAAKRLMVKYDLKSTSCETCNLDAQTKIFRLRTMLHTFQISPSSLQNFKEKSLGVGLDKQRATQSFTYTPCCPIAFYGCIVVCAATVELFPVYLICCGGCYLGTCCGYVKPVYDNFYKLKLPSYNIKPNYLTLQNQRL